MEVVILLLAVVAVRMTLHLSHLDDDELMQRGGTNHEDHGKDPNKARKDPNKARSKDLTMVPLCQAILKDQTHPDLSLSTCLAHVTRMTTLDGSHHLT